MGLVPDERITVSPIPVGFAVPASFFDYHMAPRQNGKINRLINASLPALGSRFENQKATQEQAPFFRLRRLRFAERIAQPGRNSPARCTFVAIAFSSRGLDKSGGAVA